MYAYSRRREMAGMFSRQSRGRLCWPRRERRSFVQVERSMFSGSVSASNALLLGIWNVSGHDVSVDSSVYGVLVCCSNDSTDDAVSRTLRNEYPDDVQWCDVTAVEYGRNATNRKHQQIEKIRSWVCFVFSFCYFVQESIAGLCCQRL